MRIIDAHATVRASLYLYNDTNDVDILADALTSADDIFGL
jgi:selenocysteine lyase/cysteine desulfurase